MALIPNIDPSSVASSLTGTDFPAGSAPALARDNTAPMVETGLFWDRATLATSEARWSKSFPYQLLVLSVDANGKYVPDSRWLFTLPIPPESITVSTPFAVSTNVTLGGVVEQHGGAPIKLISFQGTVGVVPGRGSAGQLQKASFGGLGANTIQAGIVAFNQSVAQAKSVLGIPQQKPNLYDSATQFSTGPSEDLLQQGSTGYYQFRLLQRFLESYAELKKSDPNAKGLRLAVAMWKDEAVYLVSPIDFTFRRSAQSPLEYMYSLQFRAWKRVDPSNFASLGSAFVSASADARDPSLLNKVLNGLTAARDTIHRLRNVISAAQTDVDNIMEVLRQGILVCKDGIGLKQALSDWPDAIAKDWHMLVLGNWKAFQNQLRTGFDSGAPPTDVIDDFRAIDSAGLALQSGAPYNGTDKYIWDEPKAHRILTYIEPGNLRVPASLRAKMNLELQTVRSLSRLDFEQKRDQLQRKLEDFTDAVGAGHATYNKTYNRNATKARKTAPTPDDFEAMFAMNAAVVEMSRLAAHRDVSRELTVTPMEYVAGLAALSGIDFHQSVSKFPVPFPYGYTLEELSLRYLGDAKRWHEIATLNNLREPYVDEVGFQLPLLVNARGQQILVADGSNLFPGQTVWIEAPQVLRTKHRVLQVEQLAPAIYSVTLDGTALDSYTLAQGSFLTAYLPNTVNSQMMIYIPSAQPAQEDPKLKSVPGVNDDDHLLNVGGIDLLLTSEGDLVVTPDGDCRLAYGLTNIVQTARIILATPKGSLIQHPDFGLDAGIGRSVADISARDLLSSVNAAFRNDPMFDGVPATTIVREGPTTRIAMEVAIRGTDQTIPISVNVQP